ncbi:fumarylacetoacetase [Luteitalea sp.]|uniref:fumarylacetoacetase n=1 Tax=Luteitalea sp. TaxID=2004800 RepID=UPI0025BE280A|nr:fumarylacetoacetase [Luteitalea sp.]
MSVEESELRAPLGQSAEPIPPLAYGAFTASGSRTPRPGCALGDRLLDLTAATSAGLFDDHHARVRRALQSPRLDGILALERQEWAALYNRVRQLLTAGEQGWRSRRDAVRSCLVPMTAATLHLPMTVGDYTDFYASIHHATNVGTMLRPDQPLLPNYRHLPVGYHGRASSVVVSGTPVRRPWGQTLPQGAQVPTFGPSQRLDYELEVGLVIGGENPLGEPVPVGQALDRVFGLVLLNDWSARDIQAWEYQPLGPFLGKSFATSISAWVVPLDALATRVAPAPRREANEPPLLPYLLDADDQAHGSLDVDLEVWLSTEEMRRRAMPPVRVSRSNLRDLAWTPAQLVAHHTSNGCNLRPGDLLGTGTVSGPSPESRGCLLERTWRGTEPLALPTGESRRFLDDGDEVTLTSPWLGACRGRIVPRP